MVPAVLEPLILATGTGTYQPHVAASMETKEGGRRYVFRLRPNVHFHDGRPLTSEDVKYTLDKLIGRNPPSELLRVELADLEEVLAPQLDRVELVLRRPNYLLPATLAEIGILPAHVHGRFGLRNPKLNWMPIGSGPFRVLERKTRDTVVLVPSDRYWGQRPRLPRVIVTATADPARALASLRNGDLDILPSVYPGYYPDQLNAARLKERFRFLRLHPYRMRLILYNLRDPILRDRRVRLAIERLVDRERMIREQRHDLAQSLTAPLWPLSAWYDRTIHPTSFDRAAAVKLLEGSGWVEPRPGAVRTRAGKPLRIRMLRSRESAEMQEVARVLTTDLRSAGIELQVEAADFGFLKAQLKRGRFEMALAGLAPRPESDLSPLLHKRGELNYGGYSNPMADALLEALRTGASPEERTRTAQRLHRVLHEDPPYAVLYAPIDLMLVGRRVKGVANNGRWPRLAPITLSEE